MKELTLSVNTSASQEKENQVVLTAKFESHAEAVAFHDVLARACKDASGKKTKVWFMNSPPALLPRPTVTKDDGVGG